MPIPTTGKIIAYSVDARTTRDLQRITIPGFDIWATRSAAAALAAAQSAGPLAAVLLAEHVETASPPAAADASSVVTVRQSDAAVLLAAAKIRCPHVRRVMLVPADLLPWMIRMIHAGTAETLVALPIETHELISAVMSAERAA